MSRALALARLVMTAALLGAVYNGSRIALVGLLALIVLTQEIQGVVWRGIVERAHAQAMRLSAFRGDRAEEGGSR